MERPDFLPEGDYEWLDGLLKELPHQQAEPLQDSTGRIDFDQFNELEKDNIRVAFQFVNTTYQKFIPEVVDVDRSALEMMRSLAFFLENFAVERDGTRVRVCDLYPNVTVRHVQTAARLRLQEAEDMLKGALAGTDRHRDLGIYKTHFTNLLEVSVRAVEMEDRRKQREQGLW